MVAKGVKSERMSSTYDTGRVESGGEAERA